MTALSLFNARINNIYNIINDIGESDRSYYMFLGKADAWSDSISVDTDTIPTPSPVKTLSYEQLIRQNMLSISKISQSRASFGIRRYNWSSGSVYVGWDSNDPDIFTKQFYVVTSSNKVYKCIRTGPTTSQIEPTQTEISPQLEADGYMWKYMYTLDSLQSSNFVTPSHFAVKTVNLQEGQTIGDLTDEDQFKYNRQVNSEVDKGKIYVIKVISGGTGYTNATVEISGNGQGCTATAVIDSTTGTITSINVTSVGSNYSISDVVITGDGTGAKAYAILSPHKGHGTDPVRELGANFLLLSTSLQGDESGNLVVGDDYRQVGIIKNPKLRLSDAVATEEHIRIVRGLKMNNHTGPFISSSIGTVITGSTSGAKAFAVQYDSAAGIVYYSQNEKTGFKSFQISEQITSSDSTSEGEVSEMILPSVDIDAGQIILIDNKQPSTRSAEQLENYTIVIQF